VAAPARHLGAIGPPFPAKLYCLGMTFSVAYGSWFSSLMRLNDHSTDRSGVVRRDNLAGTVEEARQTTEAITTAQLSEKERSALLFMSSSVTLNCAEELGDANIINEGRQVAEKALRGTTPDQPLHFQCRYNVASAISAGCDLDMPTTSPGTSRVEWEPHLIDNRVAGRLELRDARREYFEIGSSDVADDHTRSAAYCNLANLLDHSGRWAEAYDFYLRALRRCPDWAVTSNTAPSNMFLPPAIPKCGAVAQVPPCVQTSRAVWDNGLTPPDATGSPHLNQMMHPPSS